MTKLSYSEARLHLKSGDLVFYRVTRKFGWSWIAERLVSWWQNSPYVHVGIIEMNDDIPWIVDMSSLLGGRDVQLGPDLIDYEVDIYRVNVKHHKRLKFEDGQVKESKYKFEADYILAKIKELIKKPYSWKANARIILERWFGYDRLSNDEAIIRSVNCATVIEAPFNDAGFDLCPRTSPNFATPDRLARSALLDCLFTISE